MEWVRSRLATLPLGVLIAPGPAEGTAGGTPTGDILAGTSGTVGATVDNGTIFGIGDTLDIGMVGKGATVFKGAVLASGNPAVNGILVGGIPEIKGAAEDIGITVDVKGAPDIRDDVKFVG